MILIRKILFVLTLAALFSWPRLLCAQHVHINAGASNTTQNAQLYFPNGYLYATNASYDVYLTFTNAGSFSNLYQGAGVTFTALASTPDNGGPAFRHAADGAYLQLQFVSISGPPNGVFGVWEQDVADASINNLLFAIPVGTTTGTNQFNLSESDGSPGSDPYGHIHGRTFTASKPGLYTLGCRILDTSSNGTGGGPIHTPSAIYYFYFQAGTTIASLSHDGFNAIITFAGTLGKGYYVQSTTNFVNTNLWQDIAGPFTGNLLQSVTDTNINAAARYYRLRVTTP